MNNQPLVLLILMLTCINPAVAQTEQFRTGSNVKLGEQYEVRVGEVIYSEFEYMALLKARLNEPFERRLRLGKISISTYDLMTPYAHKGKVRWCTDTGTGLGYATCLYDEDDDGKFERIKVPEILFFGKPKPVTPLPYEIFWQPLDIGGFKFEILYVGLDDQTLRLSYREFIDDMARPAFTQDLTYRMEKNASVTIFFREAEIEIMGVSN